MDKSLKKKKVLFIGCGFFKYDNYIVNEISRKAQVEYIESGYIKHHYYWLYVFFMKIMKRGDLFVKLEEAYLYRKLKKINTKTIDDFLLIYGVTAPLNQLHFDFLKNRYPNVRSTLYLWDDWERIDKKDLLFENFTRIYSFDTEDCIKYGFRHRPLFYTDNASKDDKKYDVYHLGNCHVDRFKQMLGFKKIFNQNGINYKIQLVIGARPYYIAKLFKKGELYENLDLLNPITIRYDDYLDNVAHSKAVIDIPHPSQCGLTIRSIETLAKRVKLITTNKYIKDHKDIPSSMYFVLSGDGVENGLSEFISSPVAESLPISYSLESFVNELIFQ